MKYVKLDWPESQMWIGCDGVDVYQSMDGPTVFVPEEMYEKCKPYTFRFHTHGWTDITVIAENEEEAYNMADDKYNEGDYKDGDTGFENIDVENITEG